MASGIFIPSSRPQERKETCRLDSSTSDVKGLRCLCPLGFAEYDTLFSWACSLPLCSFSCQIMHGTGIPNTLGSPMQPRLRFWSFRKWLLWVSMQGLPCHVPGLPSSPSPQRKILQLLYLLFLYPSWLKPEPHEEYWQVWGPLREEPGPLRWRFQQPSFVVPFYKLEAYLGSFILFVNRPFFSLLISPCTSLRFNIKFPGVLFLFKLYILYFFFPLVAPFHCRPAEGWLLITTGQIQY